MNSATMLQSNLWSILSEVIPAPERDEVARVIGFNLIDANQTLLREIASLKDILSEMSSDIVNLKALDLNSSQRYLAEESVLPVPPMVLPGSSVMSIPANYTGIEVSSPLKHSKIDTKKNRSVFDGSEVLHAVRHYLSADKVHAVVDRLRASFAVEKVELEKELVRLSREVEGEVEEVVRCRSPRSGSRSGSRLEDSGASSVGGSSLCSNCGTPVVSASIDAYADVVCPKCRREKKLHGRLPKHEPRPADEGELSRLHSENTSGGSSFSSSKRGSFDMSEFKDSVLAPTSTAARTKFMGRIKAAMDEHHFLDDF